MYIRKEQPVLFNLLVRIGMKRLDRVDTQGLIDRTVWLAQDLKKGKRGKDSVYYQA